MEVKIQMAAKAIAQADSLVITAGAGMGVDSGLPDFRGSEGFWQAYPAFAALGLRFAELASPVWFRRDPALAWGFYGHRRNLYRDTRPHEGFAILKGWAERMPGGAFVFTSNVDGQFQKAGFADIQIAECHGSIFHVQCSTPCSQSFWPDAAPVMVDEDTMRAQPPFPLCPHCGAVARPNILMFNDGVWLEERTEQQLGRFQTWLEASVGERLVVIEMGAGSAIPTVRHMSESLMRQIGATLIRINPRESDGPPGTISLPVGAQSALEQIAAQAAEWRH